MLLVDALRAHAESRAAHPALVWPELRLTYGELGERVRQAAALLRQRGVRAGDRVAVAMDRTPAAVVLHLATLALGATSVPLAPDAGSALTGTVDRLLRPVFWYSPEAGEALWQEIGSLPPDSAAPPADPDAVALILCTSGTAGEPKCVLLTHQATAAAADQINRFTGLDAEDREVLTLPLHHSFGLGRLRCLLLAGATGFVQPGIFRPERLLSAIRRENATVFAQVPAGMRLLLALGERARAYAESIRTIEIGSAALTVAEREQVLALFPQARICHHFGLTEASRSVFCEYRDLARRGKLDSLGRPTPGVEVALDDPRQAGDRLEGLLKVRGPHVCAGYANPSLAGEHASPEGWWPTGDRVQIDAEGFLFYVGREDDLVNLGGFKVAPEEIEKHLVEIAGVRDAAVVGCQDPAAPAATVLVAFIQPADPLHPPAEIDLQHSLYGVLEPYKIPSRFRFVAELPRTENGKIRRAVLSQEFHSMSRDLDAIAQNYDSQTDFDRYCIEHEADLFLQGYEGGSVLELGCASGGMTRRLVETVERLVVVDGSRLYLDALRNELGDRAALVHSLFEEFTPGERFRHILAARILEHLADPVAFLRKVRGWLEPEGRLHVIVPNAYSFHRLLGLEMGLLRDVHELGERDHCFGHLRVYDTRLLESHLTQAGFEIAGRESVLLKPLSNAQMESWPEEIVRALFRMTRYFPEYGNELYFQCTPSQS